jgi:hypothetical protein
MALSLDPATPPAPTSASPSLTLTSNTLTTITGSGLIVAAVTSNQFAGIASVTAPGLTFALREQITGTGGLNCISIWTAPYTSNFSGVITATQVDSGAIVMWVWGVGGAATSSSFDTGAGIPGSSKTAALPSITTTNANDFVYSVNSLDTATDTAGSGWTLLTPATGFTLIQFQITSATGTFSPTTGTSDNTNGSVIDAIVAATGGGGGGGNFVPHTPWPQIGPLLAQKRKQVGWATFFDPRRRVQRPSRGLLVPSRQLIVPRKAA